MTLEFGQLLLGLGLALSQLLFGFPHLLELLLGMLKSFGQFFVLALELLEPLRILRLAGLLLLLLLISLLERDVGLLQLLRLQVAFAGFLQSLVALQAGFGELGLHFFSGGILFGSRRLLFGCGTLIGGLDRFGSLLESGVTFALDLAQAVGHRSQIDLKPLRFGQCGISLLGKLPAKLFEFAALLIAVGPGRLQLLNGGVAGQFGSVEFRLQCLFFGLKLFVFLLLRLVLLKLLFEFSLQTHIVVVLVEGGGHGALELFSGLLEFLLAFGKLFVGLGELLFEVGGFKDQFHVLGAESLEFSLESFFLFLQVGVGHPTPFLLRWRNPAGRILESMFDFKQGAHSLNRIQNSMELIQGDCLEVLPGLAEGSIDVVVTSPPYNLGISYGLYDDDMGRAEYLDWLERWAIEIRRVMHDGSSLFLNLGGKPTDPWVPFEVLGRLRAHFRLQNVIHWVKSIAIDKSDVGNYGKIQEDVAVGHYKPINSKRFLNDCHEYVFHLTRSGKVTLDRLAVGVEYQDKSNIARWQAAGSGRRCRGNTWFIPYKTIQWRDRDRPHPATFPVELARKCILVHGLRPQMKVLDPFLGIGHAAVAAAELGVDFTGIELDPHYLEVAREITGLKEDRQAS